MADRISITLRPAHNDRVWSYGADTCQLQPPVLEDEEKKKKRKRLQNRLNQRARREPSPTLPQVHVFVNAFHVEQEQTDDSKIEGTRIRCAEEAANSNSRRPYTVTRWRLDENNEKTRKRPKLQPISSAGVGPLSNYGLLPNETFDVDFDFDFDSKCAIFTAGQQQMRKRLLSPLSDHILSLIQYNVLRGAYENKRVLSSTCRAMLPGSHEVVSLMTDHGFVASLMIEHVKPELPTSLAPTFLQKTVGHSTWIKLLPFPRLRDNLIKWEDTFSHQEFVGDLIGTHVVRGHLFRDKLSARDPPLAESTLAVVDENGEDAQEPPDERSGMMLWGEPYLASNWEVTPSFWKKWAWAMEGCDDLLRSSNHWRKLRGAAPLRVHTKVEAALP